eukprot:COSAG05_NODE_8565_length_692_cov_2.123103_1_plen_186_part_01
MDPILLLSNGQAASASAAGRECFFDNAKAVTVLVVILSHTLMAYVNIGEVPLVNACSTLAALVAMPAFSFVSGHLSSADLKPRRMVSILKTLVAFIVYQLLYFVYQQLWANLGYTASGKGPGAHNTRKAALPFPIWDVEGVTWFMLCLVVWRATLPLVVRLKRPITVTFVVCVVTLLFDEGQNFMP